ncbi:hypothetical protein [Carbonactinospora thermoautotrophica]|uniref:hypothetical protein n=1 Tax=Carbonactinospora thermoautotrophica TaxID=1469144 RepID=UPI00226DD45C|nr:hypothetical protein [Carbonactinospora thermoautotrophica]
MLMGLAFLPLLLAGPVSRQFTGVGGLALVLLCTVVLTVGMMLAQPYAMDLIPRLAGERRIGTYYGLYYLVGGLAAAGGNAAIGALIDFARRSGMPALPWLVLAGFGVLCALAVTALDRRADLGGRR